MSDFGYTIGVDTGDGVANLQKLEKAQNDAKAEAKRMGDEMKAQAKAATAATKAAAAHAVALEKQAAKAKNYGGGSGKGGMAAVAAANTLQDAQYGFMGVQNNLIQMASMAGRFAAPLAIGVTAAGVAWKLFGDDVSSFYGDFKRYFAGWKDDASSQEAAIKRQAQAQRVLAEQTARVAAEEKKHGDYIRVVESSASKVAKTSTYNPGQDAPFEEAKKLAAGNDPAKQAQLEAESIRKAAAARAQDLKVRKDAAATAEKNMRDSAAAAGDEKAAMEAKGRELQQELSSLERLEKGSSSAGRSARMQNEMVMLTTRLAGATAEQNGLAERQQAYLESAKRLAAERLELEARIKEENQYQNQPGETGRSRMEQEILNIQTKATQEKEKQASQERKMLEDAEKRGRAMGESIMKDAKATQERQAAFLKDYQGQASIDKARADGKGKEAREMERQRDLEAEIQRIQEQGGVTKAEAEKMARQNMADRMKTELEGLTAGGRANANTGLAAREAAAARKQAREARRAMREMEDAAKRGAPMPAGAAKDGGKPKTETLLEGIMNVLKEKLTVV